MMYINDMNEDHDYTRMGAKIQRFYEMLWSEIEPEEQNEKNVLLSTLIEEYEKIFFDVLEL